MVFCNLFPFGRLKSLGLGARLAAVICLLSGPVGAETTASGFLSRMGDLASPAWFVSNFTIKSPGFRTAWRRKAIYFDFENESVVLNLLPAEEKVGKDFIGSELQRRKRTHFGRYEVIMIPAKGEGVISSFFTYTGAQQKTAHDEIDIEFLGRDTRKIWVNRFADGKKLPGRWIDLGFDAAEAPHLYAFDWQPDSLTWFVDGVEILRVTSAEFEIPQLPQKVYINLWGGANAQRDWSGVAPKDTQASAHYYCLSYRPKGDTGAQCSDQTDLQ